VGLNTTKWVCKISSPSEAWDFGAWTCFRNSYGYKYENGKPVWGHNATLVMRLERELQQPFFFLLLTRVWMRESKQVAALLLTRVWVRKKANRFLLTRVCAETAMLLRRANPNIARPCPALPPAPWAPRSRRRQHHRLVHRPCSAKKPANNEEQAGGGGVLSKSVLLRSGVALFALGFVDAG
jgi:hypothetical protein